jgi:septal ring factor EnvC (AmiA/AmiB activator)
MYDDEYKHRMQELQIWADNLQAETARYGEQQANYRAQLEKQLNPYQQYLMDKDKKETAKAEAAAKAQQEAAKAAKEAKERAKANPYKNTYATKYAAKNPLEWLATGGPAADVFEHGLNWLSGSNVGSYGRYGR